MSHVRYATVALSLPFKYHSGGTDGLSYSIPPELAPLAVPGVRALVPLGRRHVTGVLVATSHLKPEITAKLRAITDILDPKPIFDEQFLEWTKWIAKYYMTSWGDVLQAALPEGLKPETSSRVVLDHPDPLALAAQKGAGKKRPELLRLLADHPEGKSIAQIQKALHTNSIYALLHTLEQDGILHLERPLVRNQRERTEQVARLPDHLRAGSESLSLTLASLERTAPRQANILLSLLQHSHTSAEEAFAVPLLLKQAGASAATLKALHEKGLVVLERQPVKKRTAEYLSTLPGEHDIQNLTLTEEQRYAAKQISEQVRLGEHKTFLLHGVTGSGKTEVYTSVAQEVLAAGHGVLILVPEIALTPQLIDRFKSRLSIERDEDIAVLHSKLSANERSAAFRSLVEGRARIAIGARSAVFAPVRDLRLIIVDEEHEGTFKQFDKTPRYNARDAAIVRGAMRSAVVVLGSATPALESYQNAIEGKYQLLKMKERAKRASMPTVTIVDQRRAANRPGFDRARTALTPVLQEAILARLKKKEGIVLFQNRRGFSTYLECTNCGEPEMCPNCAVTMTYHRAKSQMQCHYCGYYTQKKTTCSVCGSEDLRLGGLGTERVQEDLLVAFPDAKVERMDLDTTARKGSFKKILTSFASGASDILLGTQMVAKGLDFPRVTLVGVISADTSLCLPDFRASERTFQLLSQVAGRAGRSEELPGEVLIQSLQPLNRAIVLASQHNYEEFFQLELEDRRKLNYPPFSRLILIEFRGLHEQAVKERALAFGSLFPERGSFYERIGPAAPTILKLRNEYRWHLLIKDIKKSDPNGEKIRRLLTGALDQYQSRFASAQVNVTVDVDVQGVT
jgi:primosomal protein N' (replication factor Y)